MKRARWLLAIPLLAIAYFFIRFETTDDWLVGPPKRQDLVIIPPGGHETPESVKTAAVVQPPGRPPPPPTRDEQGPPPPLPPPVINQPPTVPENLPQGLRTPAANFAPDGGVVFPFGPKGIAAAMAEAKPEMQHCYEMWLKAKPDLQGTLPISFTVRPADGGNQAIIDEVHLHDSDGVGSIAFEGCVLNVVSNLRFESPPMGAVEVRVPMTFSNNGEPDSGP
jgi:hypothetical protein